MGNASFEIGSILGTRGNTKAKLLKNGGTVFVRVEKTLGSGSLFLKMNAANLTKTEGLFKRSDPFYQVTKQVVGPKGTEWKVAHRSKEIRDNLNPEWNEDILDVDTLCGGDLNSPFILGVYDHENNGNHKLMGQIETTVNGLLITSEFILTKEGEETGKISVLKALLTSEESNLLHSQSTDRPVPKPTPTFTDYISGGCEINICFAIDFTGSNGDPRRQGTLHYMDPSGRLNDYEKAITAIGRILSSYDTDQRYPVWGFGAKYNGSVYQCFQCGTSAEHVGIAGVIAAYRKTFQSGLIMSGPTVITEVIRSAAAVATRQYNEASREGKQHYTVLLILTDGCVSDVKGTLDVLGEVSSVPLSIVIVGVGNEDFSGMRFLDDQASHRDIVQFVRFNDHLGSPHSLTKATLSEIPQQLVSYFSHTGVDPLPPVVLPDEQIQIEQAEEDIDMRVDYTSNQVIPSSAIIVPQVW